MSANIKIRINDNEMIVSLDDYISAKTKDLMEFGYPNLTEKEVSQAVENVLMGKSKTVIEKFVESDLVIENE